MLASGSSSSVRLTDSGQRTLKRCSLGDCFFIFISKINGYRRTPHTHTERGGSFGGLCVCVPHPCAALRWQVCSRPGTPCWGAGGTQLNTPPRRSGRSGPWRGGPGPGSYSGMLPSSAAPRSPGPALITGGGGVSSFIKDCHKTASWHISGQHVQCVLHFMGWKFHWVEFIWIVMRKMFEKK